MSDCNENDDQIPCDISTPRSRASFKRQRFTKAKEENRTPGPFGFETPGTGPGTATTGNTTTETTDGGTKKVNPFNSYLLQSMSIPAWSPGVLEFSETPEDKKKLWSIDQVSILFPSKIEESPSTHQNEGEIDQETEDKVQSAIEKFFDEPSGIVPSPMFTSSPIVRSQQLQQQIDNKVDSWTNTELSFPNVMPIELISSLSRFKIKEPLSSSILSDENMDTSNNLRRKLEFSFESVFSEESSLIMGSGMDKENRNYGDCIMISPNVAMMKEGNLLLSPDGSSPFASSSLSPMSNLKSETLSNIKSPDATPIRFRPEKGSFRNNNL